MPRTSLAAIWANGRNAYRTREPRAEKLGYYGTARRSKTSERLRAEHRIRGNALYAQGVAGVRDLDLLRRIRGDLVGHDGEGLGVCVRDQVVVPTWRSVLTAAGSYEPLVDHWLVAWRLGTMLALV